MFPISDFLIYCFVAAYTPGANNLLSMRNATRLGFRKSFKFNIGITAMSLYILPIFHSTMSLVGFTLILTILGASGSYVWALFGSIFCKFFAKYPKTVNLIMALLLVYCAVSLFL